MTTESKLLWVGELSHSTPVRDALGDRWELMPFRADRPLAEQLREVCLAVVYTNGRDDVQGLSAILNDLDRSAVVEVVMPPGDAQASWRMLSRRRGQFICLAQEAPAQQLAAALAAAASLQPVIHSLHTELSAARGLSGNGATPVAELDEEMRLASRLQRDFLPRSLPQVGPIQFAVAFHPASWVSGDIYDVTRLDETHVGFYVADAVGHGMPAALMTMFIKKALQTKRITGNTYEIVPPEVSLAQLNADICVQDLTSCQFCTAVYAVLDTADLTLTFSRAGHPEPLLIRPDGSTELLKSPGSLLGVFAGERFESRRVQLTPGDRLLVYSDGAEEVLCHTGDGTDSPLWEVAQAWRGMSRDQLIRHFAACAKDRPRGGARFEDDITVLIVDVES